MHLLLKVWLFLFFFLSTINTSSATSTELRDLFFIEPKANFDYESFYRALDTMLLSNANLDINYAKSFYHPLTDDVQELNQIEVICQAACHFFMRSKFQRSTALFEIILIRGYEKRDWREMIAAYNFLGIIAEIEGRLPDLYLHSVKLLELAKQYDAKYIVPGSLNMGSFFYKIQQFERAKKFYSAGLQACKKNGNYYSEYGWLLHRLGELHIHQEKYEEALKYLQRGIVFWEETNDKRGFCFTQLQLARAEFPTDPERAIQLATAVLEISRENAFWLCNIEALMALGIFNNKLQNHNKAIEYLELCTERSSKKQIPYYFKGSYQILAESYAAIGKPNKANESWENYFKESKAKIDLEKETTLEWLKSNESLVSINEEFEAVKANQKESQEKLELQQRYTLLAILFMFIFSILAYIYYKKNQLIKLQKEELLTLNQRFSAQTEALERANQNISNQKQELEIELVKKLLLHSEQQEIVKRVGDVVNQMPDNINTLALKKMVAESQNDNLWEELDLQINNANQVFFEKLLKKFPQLTANDLRLCAFLKMNLSTKEIANLTFGNPESIKVARSRLRKKLDLTHTNTNVSSFLNTI